MDKSRNCPRPRQRHLERDKGRELGIAMLRKLGVPVRGFGQRRLKCETTDAIGATSPW